MLQENVEIVRQAIAAVDDRDVDRYLTCCTADVQLRAPQGVGGGVYEGPAGIQRFNANLFDAGPDFRVVVESLEPVGSDRVLAFVRVTWHGRASGIAVAEDFPTATIYDLVDGKINRVRISRPPRSPRSRGDARVRVDGHGPSVTPTRLGEP